MAIDKVEWLVGYRDDKGTLITGMDGAQSVFSKSSAEKLAKKLGGKWSLWHMASLLSPEDHEAWIDHTVPGNSWGSQWGK